MPDASPTSYLPAIVIFCTAAVFSVPLVRRIGLASVTGYLIAGIVIGPYALGLVGEPDTIRGVAEIGVVFLLFLIGLELRLPKLLAMKSDIFALGTLQVLVTGLAIGAVLMWFGFGATAAIWIGLAFALSATAIALQIIAERGDMGSPYGQRVLAVLIMQDISVIPILAVAPFLGSTFTMDADGMVGSFGIAALKALAAIIGVVLAGRYLLNPIFRILALSGAREVMTAAALLIVLGAALAMQEAGLSTAMGAFLAGLILAESNFRHQLEADIEPFRGILLGLFFMSVGMSIDLPLLRDNALILVAATFAIIALKGVVAGALARLFRSDGRQSASIGVLLTPAGEFTFVLLPLGATLGILAAEQASLAVAVAALTMLVGPVAVKLMELVLPARAQEALQETDEAPMPVDGSVLVIGFGRFGQVVNQVLLGADIDVTVIDKDVGQVRSASSFGFKVYYGDGTRLDVLRAAGIESKRMVCVCIDDKDEATLIVDLIHAQFPHVATYVRAYDRVHAIELMNRDVTFQQRETFEGALAFGRAALGELGREESEAGHIAADVRRRDIARLSMQRAEGMLSGADLLRGVAIKPEPLIKPRGRSTALSSETRAILGEDDAARADPS